MEFDVTLHMSYEAITGNIWNDFKQLCKQYYHVLFLVSLFFSVCLCLYIVQFLCVYLFVYVSANDLVTELHIANVREAIDKI